METAADASRAGEPGPPLTPCASSVSRNGWAVVRGRVAGGARTHVTLVDVAANPPQETCSTMGIPTESTDPKGRTLKRQATGTIVPKEATRAKSTRSSNTSSSSSSHLCYWHARCIGVTWRIFKPEYKNDTRYLRQAAQMLSASTGVVGVIMLSIVALTASMQEDKRALYVDLLTGAYSPQILRRDAPNLTLRTSPLVPTRRLPLRGMRPACCRRCRGPRGHCHRRNLC